MKYLTFLTIVIMALGWGQSAHAENLQTLENLERERAALVYAFAQPNLSADVRIAKIQQMYRRIADVERMVMRDERLTGNENAMVKRTFHQYDISFLVHASTEKNKPIVTHWLDQLNINTQAIKSSHAGDR